MPGTTLVDLVLEGLARADPERPAVAGLDGARSPRELLEGARGVAATLAEAGVGRGDRVGLWMEKGPAAVEVILGALLAGAAYVPIDPRSPWPRCRAIAVDGELSALAVDGARAASAGELLEGQATRLVLADVGPERIRPLEVSTGSARSAGPAGGGRPGAAGGPYPPGIETVPLAEARRRRPAELRLPDPDDVAYVLYTSGSTGTPKGVVHTHASGAAFVRWIQATFATGPDDVFASHAPLHFDLSISDVFAALASGGAVRLLSALETMLPAYLVRGLDPWGITVWYSVPSALVAMLEAGLEERPPRALRTVLFAGEVFPTPQLRRLRRALPRARLANLFGPTETNVCTWWEVPPELPDGQDAPIPIGRGCEHLETFAVDDDGRVVDGPGAEGTLWVRGANVTTGYWRDPERTAALLRPDPRGGGGLACCTGDRVRRRPDGGWDFLGRRDHMVKTRGFRVDLGEIEAALTGHPEVLEAVATPLPDPRLGSRLVASVVLRPGSASDAEALRARCAERLPGYMVPEELEVVAKLPRTSSGKVDRAGLRAAWEGRAREGRDLGA